MQTDVAFEARFTVESRRIIRRAESIAAEMRHPAVSTEDLLLAMLEIPSEARRVLASVGADAPRVRAEVAARSMRVSDDEALAAIGIDAAAARERITAVFGPEALDGDPPWTDLGRQVLLDAAEAAEADADRRGLASEERVVGTDWLFVALVSRDEGIAAQVVAALGVDRGVVAEEVAARQPMRTKFRHALLGDATHARYRAALAAYSQLSRDQQSSLRVAMRDLHEAHDALVISALEELDQGRVNEAVIMSSYFRALRSPVDRAWDALEEAGVSPDSPEAAS